MHQNWRDIAWIGAIALLACFVPALAQQAVQSDSSANPAAAAIADKFRLPLGIGNLTENYGDPDRWYVSKGFGDPFGKICPTTNLPVCYHLGEDWYLSGQPLGQPVYAVANGEILDFGYSPAPGGRLPGSLGNYVLIKHTLPAPGREIADFGRVNTVVSLYGHLTDLKGICGSNSVSCKVGQPVKIGALIGRTGTTGAGTFRGANLHFEMRLTNEKCLNSPKQITPNPSCLGFFKTRYPLHYANGGGWVDPTCFIRNLEAPKNDDFASAIPIPVGVSLRGRNLCATREQDEPNHAGKIIDAHGLNAGGKSVWWKFTAPKSTRYVVSTIGSDFDTVLGVYTNHSVASLKDLEPVGKQNDSENSRLCASANFCTSKVTFTAIAGVTYFIAIDGRSTDATAAASGTVRLTVTEAGPNLVVTPSSTPVVLGNEGGPFAPSTLKYSLSATQRTVAYSISNVPTWLTPSSTFGTASPTPKLVTFTVNASANSLKSGTHTATIVFGSSGSQGPQTRNIELIVKGPALQVTPSHGINGLGVQGGPFNPSSFSYQIKATIGTLKFSISGVPNWLTVSTRSGAVSTTPTTVTFKVASGANGLAVGTHKATITISNLGDSKDKVTMAAVLTVVAAQSLQVTPGIAMVSSGPHGGPFSKTSFTYLLSSTSGSIKYSITGLPNWLAVSSRSGMVSTSPKAVTFTLDKANTLPVGSHVGNVVFSNSTNGKGTTSRSVALTIGHVTIQYLTDGAGHYLLDSRGDKITAL